jgi:hypothetical protein
MFGWDSMKNGGSIRQGQTLSGWRLLFVDGFEKRLGIARLDYLHFIQHAALNSTVSLYSRNIKRHLITPLELLQRPFI